jgi:hypothetical protein
MRVGLLQLWDGCLCGFVLCNCNFICVILTANLSFNVAHCPVHVKTILHNRRIIAQWCIASTHTQHQLLGVFPHLDVVEHSSSSHFVCIVTSTLLVTNSLSKTPLIIHITRH